MEQVKFTVAQVTALCGGTLPKADGFSWEQVEYFVFEDEILQPYSSGTQIIPGPGIRVYPALVQWPSDREPGNLDALFWAAETH